LFCTIETAESFPIIGRLQGFTRKAPSIMLLILAAILIVLWGVGFIAYRVASSFIHLLLVIGLIILALHFLGR
jgi:uncharacterized ion transporter superfamily protein YfcC